MDAHLLFRAAVGEEEKGAAAAARTHLTGEREIERGRPTGETDCEAVVVKPRLWKNIRLKVDSRQFHQYRIDSRLDWTRQNIPPLVVCSGANKKLSSSFRFASLVDSLLFSVLRCRCVLFGFLVFVISSE